jgi:hypothetical protein
MAVPNTSTDQRELVIGRRSTALKLLGWPPPSQHDGTLRFEESLPFAIAWDTDDAGRLEHSDGNFHVLEVPYDVRSAGVL